MHELRKLSTTFVDLDDGNLLEFCNKITLFPFPDDQNFRKPTPRVTDVCGFSAHMDINKEEEDRKRMKKSVFRNATAQAMVAREPRPPRRCVFKTSPSPLLPTISFMKTCIYPSRI